MVLPEVLVPIGKAPQPGAILLKNDSDSSVQVAVSSATGGSPSFYKLDRGSSDTWKRTGNETVFINGGGFGQVAIAMAEPGSYIIKSSQ
jgi:hypothetical protein